MRYQISGKQIDIGEALEIEAALSLFDLAIKALMLRRIECRFLPHDTEVKVEGWVTQHGARVHLRHLVGVAVSRDVATIDVARLPLRILQQSAQPQL